VGETDIGVGTKKRGNRVLQLVGGGSPKVLCQKWNHSKSKRRKIKNQNVLGVLRGGGRVQGLLGGGKDKKKREATDMV